MSLRSQGKVRSWLSRGVGLMLIVLSLASFVLMAHAILLRYHEVVDLNEQIAEINDQLAHEKQRQSELTQQIELLSEPAYIELLAREQLGLIRADDIPYGWGTVEREP